MQVSQLDSYYKEFSVSHPAHHCQSNIDKQSSMSFTFWKTP